MKAVHTMKEIPSLLDAILVLVLMEGSLVPKHVCKHVIMKVTHIMKEILSLVLMDAILVLALLEMSLVQ